MDPDSTIPLSHMAIFDAWESYVAYSKVKPSMSGFLRWLRNTDPATFNAMNEPEITGVVESMIAGR